jgi:hypothetical protein
MLRFFSRPKRKTRFSLAGASVFDGAATALEFFGRDFWKGGKPQPSTILEVCPVGDSARYRVRVGRVLEWQRSKTSTTGL